MTHPLDGRTAQRTAVLDSGTCSACQALDGKTVIHGSAEHRDLTPPRHCEHESGDRGCRCVWIYVSPDEEDLADEQR